MANPSGAIVLKTLVDTLGISKGLSSISKAVGVTGKAIAAIGTAAAASFIALTKSAVESYAEYEQLVGGVETLFKDSADIVQEYANNAYKTAGLSANEYMSTVTSFSASLLQSLGNDTEKAAHYADQAIVDMSDNANKMGTDMAMIQNAYQGFAKGNYTMLDNLKLGYGGTKTEMERLLKDAQSISGIEYSIDSFADVTQAIHVIQTNMGITGTTAKEAATTIQGSFSAVKASWQNLLTGMADETQDFDSLLENFIDSLGVAMGNILPRVSIVTKGIFQLVENLLPQIPALIEQMLPYVLEGVASIVSGIVKILPQIAMTIVMTLSRIAAQYISGLLTGKKNTATETEEAQAAAISTAVENQEALTDAVKETEKAQKGSLAGFDEINTLTQSTADAAADTANSSGATSLSDLEIPDMGGTLDGSTIEEEVDSTLSTIMGIIGISLAAVGVILLCSGHILWGIGFITAGATTLGVSMAASDGDPVTDTVTTLAYLMGIVGGALVAIGIMLIILGSVGLGIGLIIGGIAFIGVAIATIAIFDTNKIVSVLNLIMGIAAGALLALGVMLLIFSGPSPLAIGLIIAGASMLVAGVAFNWGTIVDTVKNVTSKIADFFKNMWSKIVNAGKSSINMIIGIVNGIIGSVEGFINLIIKGVNLLITALNKISFDVPDWVPAIGGKKLGFDLKKLGEVKLGRVPKLATGGIVPYRTFAEIGEAGTEAVLPLENNTGWMDILADKIASRGLGNAQDNRPIVLQIDGREIARAVRDGNSRLGTQTVFGGFANVY